jgi:succinate dehydrogenase hydrophobic anchor subunit
MGIDRIIVSEVIDDLVEPSRTKQVLTIVLISVGVVVVAIVVYSVKKLQKMLR